jgi:hypothetical protein
LACNFSGSHRIYSFNDIIYLNSDLHIIDVGVRDKHSPTSDTFPLYIQGVNVAIELVVYDHLADIGILPVNVTSA